MPIVIHRLLTGYSIAHVNTWGSAPTPPITSLIYYYYLSSAQNLASTQTLGSALLERIRKVQNSKYETDLLKIVDCFINGYGTVNSERVSFSIIN